MPATLECWQSASLITHPSRQGYNESQIAQIRVIRALTSSGDTLKEISILLNDSWQYRPSGWKFRRQEFIFQLLSGTDETRAGYLRELYTSYSPEDLMTFLLMPLSDWLRKEEKEVLRIRFMRCLLNITQLLKSRLYDEHTKPLLTAIKLLKHYPSLGIPERVGASGIGLELCV